MTNSNEDAVANALDEQVQGMSGKAPPAKRPKKRDAAKAPKRGEVVYSDKLFEPLSPDAPVKCLGVTGNICFFLDAHGQLRALNAKDVSKATIASLFGPQIQMLWEIWPVKRILAGDPKPQTVGWDATRGQETMIGTCALNGLWKPQDHVRGRGAWSEDGKLVVHTGGELHMSDGQVQRPGVIGRNVYPAATRSMVPARMDETLTPEEAVEELLELFETWNWARSIDPLLLLGWVISSLMAGALGIRPSVWITGEKGAGKSSLMGEGGILHLLFGDGILMTANTTAAGLYQRIQFDSLPVAIDEIEAKRGNQKTEAVIELARQAYSGGMVLRGGADHEGKEFRAQCPVLFGSILIPPLLPQDLSRLAVLNLKPFEPGAQEPKIDPERIALIGRSLLRGVLDRWHLWPERLQVWRDYLRDLGHDGRAHGQFGTLLAAADLMRATGLPSRDDMDKVAADMTPENLRETAAASTNAERCIDFAMSRVLRSARGSEDMLAGELVLSAVRRFGGETEKPHKPLDAVRFLEKAGVSVVVAKSEGGKLEYSKPNRVEPKLLSNWVDNPPADGEMGVFVAFAPDGEGILELFRGSDWEGIPNAHNPYTQALERVPGARKTKQAIRIGARVCKPILIPLAAAVDVPSLKDNDTGIGYDR